MRGYWAQMRISFAHYKKKRNPKYPVYRKGPIYRIAQMEKSINSIKRVDPPKKA